MASSEFPLSAGDFPFHSLACASNNISHLSDTFSPLSSKHFTSSYYYCSLNSDGKAESYRIKIATVGGEDKASPQPCAEPKRAPTPNRR